MWRLPLYHTLLRMLQNPIYAGAYAFGRTTTRTRVIDGAARKTGGHRSESSEWIALLRDHHESYIGWETYERNRELIAHNAQSWGPMGIRGAARQGPSLLAGHCGVVAVGGGCTFATREAPRWRAATAAAVA